jgi:CheY-like chemotaxis protein
VRSASVESSLALHPGKDAALPRLVLREETIVMKSILFADDNSHIREYCHQAFEDEGYSVILARNGDEAVQLAMKECVDLIILDLGMPYVSGIEAARRIKTICPSIPIMFYTAQRRDRLPADHRKLAVAYVEKADDLTELKHVVAKLLASCDAPER